jgi:hypothetical protein
MKLRRSTCAGLFAVAAMGVLLLDPRYTVGQPGMGGGGFGGKGGGKGGGGPGGGGGGKNAFNDPDMAFDFYARGSNSIDFSRMDPNMKVWAKGRFEKMGLPVPNDSTVVTRAQFTEAFNKSMASRGMTPAGGPQPGMAPTYGGGGPRMGDGGGGNFRMGEGGGNRGPGGGWNQGQGGNWNQGQGGNWNQGGNVSMSFNREGGNGGLEREKTGGPTNFRLTDQDIEKRFKEQDGNHDGKLSEDEVSDRLKAAFRELDTSKDGYLDLQEYKAYIAARFGGDGSDPSQGSYGSYAGNGNYGRDGRDNRPQEQPVVAIRYGKLPTGLPSWWDTLDADKDGQIGLYEWRQDGRDMKDFQKMDLDGDGYLAPQEWQRFNVISAEQAKAIAAEEEIGGSSSGNTKGGRPGGGGMYPGGGGGSFPGGGGRDKGGMFPGGGKGDKGSGDRSSDNSKNPFRSGGGGKKDR